MLFISSVPADSHCYSTSVPVLGMDLIAIFDLSFGSYNIQHTSTGLTEIVLQYQMSPGVKSAVSDNLKINLW
jgi:hypothetical protein